MVKSLHDLCLSCVMKKLDLILNVNNLPTVHKEIILTQLADHNLLTEAYLPFVSNSLFRGIRHVALYNCEQVTDKVLKSLAESKCLLESLTIHGLPVTDKGIQCITSDQRELEYLALQNLNNVTSKGLTCIKSTKLIQFDIKGCSAITCEGVEKVVKNNPTIKIIKLTGRGCTKLDDSVFSIIANNLGKNLEELHQGPHTMSDHSLTVLSQCCPNLKVLDLHGSSRLTGQSILEISQSCTQMTSLDLSYCNGLRNNPDNESLWTLPTHLTSLSLCGILLSDQRLLVECLQRLKKLRSVRLCGVPALTDKTFAEVLEHIGSNLLDLDISGMRGEDFTDNGLTAITKYCMSLKNLNISMCHQCTGETLIPMFEDKQRALNFTKLFLSARKLDLSVLMAAASSCTNLEKIDLAGLKVVNDELLSTISTNCVKLSHIGIKGCSQVTDEGMCQIARQCNLRSAVLSGIENLTDKSIFSIANHCPYLKEIYMNGCSKISSTTINYLLDCCLYRVYVQHVTPNVHSTQLMAKNLDTGEYCRADLLTTYAAVQEVC